jgi:hypothetical protein
MSTAILVLWWTTLIIVIFVVIPVVLYLLNRTYRAAHDIRVYTAEILAAAQGLARNLEGARELKRTPMLAKQLRDAAAALMEISDIKRAAGGRR